ncbi:15324_t:CDS:1, partial [Acaulospora colombiana]
MLRERLRGEEEMSFENARNVPLESCFWLGGERDGRGREEKVVRRGVALLG